MTLETMELFLKNLTIISNGAVKEAQEKEDKEMIAFWKGTEKAYHTAYTFLRSYKKTLNGNH